MKIGLEIHRQISNKKLFCKCNFNFRKNKLLKQIYLPVSLNSKLYKKHTYKYSSKNCKYQLDESNPVLNKNLLRKAISACKIFDFKILDEYVVMRKYILDGSLTSGFQRTGIIGVNGKLVIDNKTIQLDFINLEEDSCRRSKDKWIVDRQGVGLVEITTEPIENPEVGFIKKVALEIGHRLDDLKFRRKLGSIRQDINIDNGLGKVEIKGVQDISLFDKIIQNECKRQELIISLTAQLGDELDINYLEAESKIYKIIITCKNIYPVFIQQINDLTLLEELDDYLKYYSIEAIQCIKLSDDQIEIQIVPISSSKKDKIYKFFDNLAKNEFRCTRSLNNTYTKFLRDDQTKERMNVQTEMNKINLNKYLKNVEISDKSELGKNLNSQNKNMLNENNSIKNLYLYLNKDVYLDDNLINLALKIYNALNFSINTKKKITKDVLKKYITNEVTKLQLDYLIIEINKGNKNISEILQSSNFEAVSKKELQQIIKQKAYKNLAHATGCLLKELGPKAHSYEYLYASLKDLFV